MFKKNEIWFGMILGVIIPFVGFALLLTIYDNLDFLGLADDQNLSQDFRMRTLGLLAISLNLIPFAIYNKWRFTNTMRGLIFPTMIYVIVWFVRFGINLIT